MQHNFELVNEMNDYFLVFILTTKEKDNIPSSGTICASFKNKIDGGIGQGTFVFDVKTNILSITFDGLQGRGTGGDWNNEDLDILMKDNIFVDNRVAKTVHVMFRSTQFYNRMLPGTLTRVEEEAPACSSSKPLNVA